jgi:hypothetical protein
MNQSEVIVTKQSSSTNSRQEVQSRTRLNPTGGCRLMNKQCQEIRPVVQKRTWSNQQVNWLPQIDDEQLNPNVDWRQQRWLRQTSSAVARSQGRLDSAVRSGTGRRRGSLAGTRRLRHLDWRCPAGNGLENNNDLKDRATIVAWIEDGGDGRQKKKTGLRWDSVET